MPEKPVIIGLSLKENIDLYLNLIRACPGGVFVFDPVNYGVVSVG